MTTNTNNLLEIRDLVKYYPVKAGIIQHTVNNVKAVDGISFDVKEGETLSLVGESGCGKSTTGHTILRILEHTSGSVFYKGRDIFTYNRKEMKDLRKDFQIVFQDPYASLDPRLPVGESIAEGLKIHNIGTKEEQYDRVLKAMSDVGLQDFHAVRYPHEFSGGQRQRIGIARALVMKPKFIVLDEPVSALDVSIQAEVLNILNDLQRKFGLTFLFVAHNLAVVEHISDRVAVMYLGKIVELASREELFSKPLHPYTEALLSAIPGATGAAKRDRIILEGDVPSSLNPPSGCRFHPRCRYAKEICAKECPELVNFGERQVACHFASELNL